LDKKNILAVKSDVDLQMTLTLTLPESIFDLDLMVHIGSMMAMHKFGNIHETLHSVPMFHIS